MATPSYLMKVASKEQIVVLVNVNFYFFFSTLTKIIGLSAVLKKHLEQSFPSKPVPFQYFTSANIDLISIHSLHFKVFGFVRELVNLGTFNHFFCNAFCVNVFNHILPSLFIVLKLIKPAMKIRCFSRLDTVIAGFCPPPLHRHPIPLP